MWTPKSSKSFTTALYIIADDVWEAFEEWVNYLETEKFFGPADPLFPATEHGMGKDGNFTVTGISRQNWQQTHSIREIVNTAFARVSIPPLGPHSFRHTLTHIGMQICTTPRAFKTWSQNFGHADVLTTLYNYGDLTVREQVEEVATLPGWR